MKYKKIENDLFGIVGRLKLIDRNYFVLKNIFSNNFELHNKAQKGGSLCFVIGRRLNCGVLTRTRKSLRKNAKKIFGEMQRNNLRLDKKNEENTRNAYSFELKSMVDYANRKGGDVDFCGVCKTKWI